MRQILASLFAVALTACATATSRTTPATDADLLARARELDPRVITIDTHDDISNNFATPADDPLHGNRQVTLEKMRAGGLDVAFFAVYVGQTPRTPENYERAKAAAMNKFTAIHRMADTLYPNLIELAYSPDDVVRIHDSGKLVAAIGIENGYVIGKDLTLLRKYFELGARYMTLSHSQNNDICDSSGDRQAEHGGISAFGRDVVREMNRLGMMVDISHVSRDCMMQATALSTSPVIASHSSAMALAGHARNMDDEQLRAVARSDGVVQITAVNVFLKTDDPAKIAAVDSLNREMGIGRGAGNPSTGGRGGGRGGWRSLPEPQRSEYTRRLDAINVRYPLPSLKDFGDHIDYAVNVAGIDHVGISSDFDGGGGIPGWNDAGETHNVTAELLRRGYTEEEIRKLWGGNLLRVWRENERRASAHP